MSRAFTKLIPHNKANERPSFVLFVDVESIVDQPINNRRRFTPFLWTAIFKRYRKGIEVTAFDEYYGTDINSFWEVVISHTYKKTKLYIVTHHLEVDFMPLQGFIYLPALGYKMDKLISHGRVLTMYWSKESSKIIVMNNGNLFDGSIKSWGEVLGVPKLQMPKPEDSIEKWVEYCMTDTRIVMLMWNNLLEFMDQHDLGNFKLTKAGLAMNAFRHRFMGIPIAIHNDPKAILLERMSYKGGRFEALQVGNWKSKHFFNLDINSMYGYIESTASLPYELRGIKPSMSLDELTKRVYKYAVIADVNITVNEPIFPSKVNDKIVYRSGTFDTVLTTPELRYVLINGQINEIRTVAWYYSGLILKEFADYFLQLKSDYDKAGNKPMRQVTKLYLNSLYGKFGQHGYDDKEVGICSPDLFQFVTSYDVNTKERLEYAYYGGKVHQISETLAGDMTFTAIASHITAYGRLMLWNLIRIAGIENVYHVATDSLIVNAEGYKNLTGEIDQYKPGKLKLDKSFKGLIIRDVNDTRQGKQDKIKGITKGAKQLGYDRYEITEWPSITSLLKQGILDYYYTLEVKKNLSRERYHTTLHHEPKSIKTDVTGRLVNERKS